MQITYDSVPKEVNGCKLATITFTVVVVVGFSLTMALFVYNPECEVLLRHSINDLKAKMSGFINKVDIFFQSAPINEDDTPEISDDDTPDHTPNDDNTKTTSEDLSKNILLLFFLYPTRGKSLLESWVTTFRPD